MRKVFTLLVLLPLAIVGVLTLGVPPLRAQIGCSVQDQTTLLNQFSDTAPNASITPQNIRNVICSAMALFTSTTQGQVPPSGGGTTAFLRADGTWAVPPGGGGSSMTLTLTSRVIVAGASDTAVNTDFLIAWNKGVGSASAQTIPSCTAANPAQVFIIKDEKGDANTNPITVTSAAGTIEQTTSYIINSGFMALMLQCDGAGNYNVF